MLKWVHHSPPPKNHVVKSAGELDSKDKENEKQCENKQPEKEKIKEEKEILEALRRRIGVRRDKSTEIRLKTNLIKYNFAIDYIYRRKCSVIFKSVLIIIHFIKLVQN